MTVRMRHPDLPGQEIEVASSAVPLHRDSGWYPVPGQDDMGEELPTDAQRFDGQPPVRMVHPELPGQVITVAESAAPIHRSAGWVVFTDEMAAEQARAQLEDMTVLQLQELARRRDLPVSGTKPELVDRLSSDQDNQAERSGQDADRVESAEQQAEPEADGGAEQANQESEEQ